MTVSNRSCPVCASERREILIEFSAKSISSENAAAFGYDAGFIFPIVKCEDCDFVYSSRLLSRQQYQARYETLTNHAASHANELRPKLYLKYLEDWLSIAQVILRGRDTTELRVLDYGCGWGSFLKMISYPGIIGYGLDFDQIKREGARKIGVNIVSTPAEEEPYDLIVLNQVLEHLPEPLETVKELAAALKPDGHIWVSVPFNTPGLKADLEKGAPYRRVIDPWEHLNYFTRHSLVSVFREAKLSPAQVKSPTEILFKK